KKPAGAIRRLNDAANPSVSFTENSAQPPVPDGGKKLKLPDTFRLVHCCRLVAPVALEVKPTKMVATGNWLLLTWKVCEPLTEMFAKICVDTSVEEIPSNEALARMFVKRRVRDPVVPGGSTGTPSHVTCEASCWRATKMLAHCVVPAVPLFTDAGWQVARAYGGVYGIEKLPGSTLQLGALLRRPEVFDRQGAD